MNKNRTELTATDIERLAGRVRKWASDNRLGYDWALFYNGKRYARRYNLDARCYERGKVEKGVDPHLYCTYFSDEPIMCMSYDATMYRCINGYEKEKAYNKLVALLKEYDLYLCHSDSFHCEFCRRYD